MPWIPPPRPRFVQRLNAHGVAAGGAANLVSLDGAELCQTAIASTGLDDFGDDAWRAPYEILLSAIEQESKLHLAGRIQTRTEIVRTLRNRLQLSALWKQRPELAEGPIDSPVFIVGSPRSGTSILHELMACDARTRAPAMWEMNHPVEALPTPLGSAPEGTTDWSAIGDDVTQFWHDLQPEYETMHANSGLLPNECIFITLHEFLSDHWGGQHVVPSYDAHLAQADHRVAYRFHARFLKTLESRGGSKRWLLKAPSHLPQLRALFDVYPDARIVRTHRDPLRTLPSTLNLMGTLKWMRCDEVDLELATKRIPKAYEILFEREIAERAAGTLPDERFIDVRFADVMRDPAGTVGAVYEQLGWEYTDETRNAINAYVRDKPKGSRGAHRYSLEALGLDAAELTKRFRDYLAHYGVEPEGGE
jgi:hypothetical protein